jgi:hypothetical protein
VGCDTFNKTQKIISDFDKEIKKLEKIVLPVTHLEFLF